MGDAFWCRHLVATRGAVEPKERVVRERLRSAARGAFVDAILQERLGIERRMCGVLVNGKSSWLYMKFRDRGQMTSLRLPTLLAVRVQHCCHPST
jgi:hypothetical protein